MRAGERNGDDSSVTGEIDLARIARAISAKRWWVIGPTVAMFAGFRDIREFRQAAL